MSRAYEMQVEITGFKKSCCSAIKQAAEQAWSFDWLTDTGAVLEGCGTSQLCGGEGEQEFAERLAMAIWQANGGYCAVLVTATYLENLPYETFEFDEEAFKRLRQQPEVTSP